MSTQSALIVIGRYKAEWNQLTLAQQSDFIARVGETASATGLTPVTGYHLRATPGAFIEIWESADAYSIETAIKNLNAIGYAQYVDARWMVGERTEGER